MWPRVAWWVLSIAAIPAAKYVWDKILESPSYQDDVAKANAAKAAKEKAEKEELERLRKLERKRERIIRQQPRTNGHLLCKVKNRDEILFRKFDGVGK